MSVLTTIYRNLLWIAPPLMCAALLALGLCIRNVVRLARESKILSVPLVEAQSVEFREAGRVVLAEEGPRFSRRFWHLSYQLDTEYGAPVPGRPTVFRATTSGVSTARREMRLFEVPHPGRYRLRVQNLGPPREDDARHRLVFTRPHLGPTVVNILGIVFSGIFFIASLVFFLMRIFLKDSPA